MPISTGIREAWRVYSTHLVVWELVQEAAFVDMLRLENDISIATSTSRRDNVLQKCGWNEEYDDEQVYDCAYGAGAFRNLPLVGLGHVDALQACLDKVGAGPQDQWIGCCEGKSTQGNGGDYGCTLANSMVEDRRTCSRDGGQRDSFGIAKGRCGHIDNRL